MRNRRPPLVGADVASTESSPPAPSVPPSTAPSAAAATAYAKCDHGVAVVVAVAVAYRYVQCRYDAVAIVDCVVAAVVLSRAELVVVVLAMVSVLEQVSCL